MADTNFIDQKTVIEADWLNDVNQLAYTKTYPDGTHSPTSESLAASSGASEVGFQQVGAGAVLRTVEDKLTETLSVGDFGDVDNVGTVVLNVPGQFASVSAVFDYLKGRTIAAGTTVQIKIADGTYPLLASIYAAHPNGDQIEIIGNEANPELCMLQASTSDGIYLPQGFQLKRLNGVKFVNTTVKSAATPYLGILTDGGVFMKVGPKVTVDNFYYGLAARNGGKIFAPGDATNHVVVTNAGDVGIWAFNNSFVDCRYADVSYCDDYAANGLGGGIVAEFSSNIQANNVRTHHNALCGFSVLSGSSIRAWSSTADYNKHGVITGSNGVIELFGTPACVVSNNTEYGLYSGDGCGRVFGAEVVTFSGNALGNTFSRFEFASNGALTVKSGSVTIDSTRPGALTGDASYFDFNSKASEGLNVLRSLKDGVEMSRLQHRHDSDIWEWSMNGQNQLRLMGGGKVVVGRNNTAAGDTSGHVQIPKVAGAPTGTVTDTQSGYVPVVYDSLNDRLSVFNSTWKHVQLNDQGVLNIFAFMTPAQIADVQSGAPSLDHSAAIDAWVSAIKSSGRKGYAPAGRFRRTSAWTIDMAACSGLGLTIEGDGMQRTIFDLTPVSSGVPFQVTDSNGSTGGDTFYLSLLNFGVHANVNGVGAAIGKSDLSDAFNASVFDRLYFANANTGASACALEINYVVQSAINVTANCSASGAAGTAVRVRQMQFCTLTGSGGNGTNSLHFTGGYSFGNNVMNWDAEEVQKCVVIDSANATSNTFHGGQFVWSVGGIDATAGSNNLFINPNFGVGSNQVLNGTGVGVIGSGKAFGNLVLPNSVVRPPSGDASLRSDGGNNTAYVDAMAGAAGFAIYRFLIAGAEKAKVQYDGAGDVMSIGGNSRTPFRFYPSSGKTTVGVGAPATNATSGLLQLPTMAGTPTGVQVDIQSGFSPVVIDSTGSKLWVYVGGTWKSATLT